MSETTVIHVRDADFTAGDIYIGRQVPRRGLKTSPWANPFPMKEESKRLIVIAWFREWAEISDDPRAIYLREHVHELRGRRLACWCHPLPCHGDVLVEMAELAVKFYRSLEQSQKTSRLTL